MLLVRGIGRQWGNRDLVSWDLWYFKDNSFSERKSGARPSRIFLSTSSLLSIQIWLMGSHLSSRNSGRVLAWNRAPSTIRAHHFWNLKISSNNVALQFPQTETQYLRIGLILALNKMVRCLTGRNFLMRARTGRTATRFRSFFSSDKLRVGWLR